MADLSEIVSRVVNADYEHAHRVMPDQPWWDNLESAFSKFPDSFDLDPKTRMLVNSTACVDIAARTLMGGLLSGLCLPLMFNPFRSIDDQAEAGFYKQIAAGGEAGRFFREPPESVEVTASEVRTGSMPEGSQCHDLSFISPYEPQNPALHDHYLRHERNRTAWTRYWRHDGSPRPTICVIHGFMADAPWFNSKLLELHWFFRKGYDVLLYTLPFHGKRQGRLSPFSGHGLFAGGVCSLNEAIAHAVYDFRIILNFLESQGVDRYGVTGISLGGYLSAILAAVEDRLAFSIPNVPVVSIADILLEWAPAGWLTRTIMDANGVTVAEARHRVAVHCPLTYAPVLPIERLMIVGGAGDRLAPPKHARLLWDHWSRCNIHWFPGNHVVHLDKGKYLKEMLGFMRGIDFR